ncbi:sugar ABC transporter permease [Streptomyces agglomeratus]|uniref:Sugar ABC transporter permease n=1 Tax=Streptomyces agglomeratus TaxID=285458 RepID=A0A1E5PBH8_9ACTN|nr:sugar ABC transporter permease [Streptomyces agglomeratus]OEJ26847.1 sugar ABC transporter permease [Streptomyces agglomeratus]OEJ39106.1 sugar ABC transporter permease [Streptomyces agglomeratus]OEJ46512.1 sugar ABC transporter permease [Streptomyces agglomeratus]OEJ51630.1 sugar ABC transporter permease [Streptomyces agglomeratus]OEJ59033.1 sugar ABC transporter permease [Streptomyces agglomeratus]
MSTTTHPLRPERRRPPTPAAKRRKAALRTAAFMSPWLIGFSVFFAYPLLSTVYFSFMDYDGFAAPAFNGLDNWTYVFRDYPMFWPAMGNTLWLVLVLVTCRVVFGLGTGLLITKIKTGTGIFRTLFYLPFLAPPVAATLAFVFLLNPGTGPVNSVLGDLGLPAPGWFNDPSWSKPALTVLAVWGIGDLMVIFMAALLDVPKEQYEAAELDGASAFQRFRFVTLPNISPIVMFAVVTGVIQTMQHYTQPLVAGKVASGVIGGSGQQFEPGYPDKSTLTLPQLVHNLGFQRFDYGAACVVSLVLFALAMAFTALLMRRGGILRAGE